MLKQAFVQAFSVYFVEGRRPSQKVKVLKLNEFEHDLVVLVVSQTFPEGKGVETQG